METIQLILEIEKTYGHWFSPADVKLGKMMTG